MQRLSSFDSRELKLIYRLLHAQLLDNPELMDSDFLHQLQRWLQYLAGQQGVDISNHGQWTAWLNNRPTGPGAKPSLPAGLALVDSDQP